MENYRDADELMQDVLNRNDEEIIEELSRNLKIDVDDDDVLDALYDLQLFFFNKGLKSASKTIIVNYDGWRK